MLWGLLACRQAAVPEQLPQLPPDTVAARSVDTLQAQRTITVLVLGNSLAAGYGLSPSEAFPAVLQRKVDSLGWPVRILNAGVSGETSAGGLRRIDWLLRERIDVLILELGANDGLRGIDPEVTHRNLQGIIDAECSSYRRLSTRACPQA